MKIINTCVKSIKKIGFFLSFSLLLSTTALAQLSVVLADTLNKTLKEQTDKFGLKGVAAAAVLRDGSTWSSAEGNYDATPLNTNLLYDIGSNTKTMVAAIILLLEEENKLSIDDTIGMYLNASPNVPLNASIKQLLNHRSGIYNYTNHPDFAVEINSNDAKFWEVDSLLFNFVDTPTFSVGASWGYSNTNYLLLGQIIEAVEGKAFNEVLKDRLFDPNNMNASFLDEYDNYTMTKVGTWLSNGSFFGTRFTSFMSAAWAAGAVVSTPEDLALWAYKLYRGEVISDSSMTKMRTGTQVGITEKYGLGLFESRYRGKIYLGHGGTTLQNSEMMYSLESDFSVVTMVIEQGTAAEAGEIEEKLIDVIEYMLEKTPVGAEELNNVVQINTFPNPSNQNMTVRLSGVNESPAELKVFDMKGQLIFQQQITDRELVLSKDQIGSGLFVLTVNQSGSLSQQRIVFK